MMNPQPKPEAHSRTKARAKRAHDKARAACRAIVYARAGGRCEVCSRSLVLSPADAPSELMLAHIHEVVHRGQGGSDTDPDNCRCLCFACHATAHNGKVSMGGGE